MLPPFFVCFFRQFLFFPLVFVCFCVLFQFRFRLHRHCFVHHSFHVDDQISMNHSLHSALLGFTGFYWVLLGFTGFYQVLVNSNGFYRFFCCFAVLVTQMPANGLQPERWGASIVNKLGKKKNNSVIGRNRNQTYLILSVMKSKTLPTSTWMSMTFASSR